MTRWLHPEGSLKSQPLPVTSLSYWPRLFWIAFWLQWTFSAKAVFTLGFKSHSSSSLQRKDTNTSLSLFNQGTCRARRWSIRFFTFDWGSLVFPLRNTRKNSLGIQTKNCLNSQPEHCCLKERGCLVQLQRFSNTCLDISVPYQATSKAWGHHILLTVGSTQKWSWATVWLFPSLGSDFCTCSTWEKTWCSTERASASCWLLQVHDGDSALKVFCNSRSYCRGRWGSV